MSKSSELKMLKYGRSIDAPINYHHRTGDSEGSGGNMLDLYTQAESAEEIYFGNEDEYAREMFLKGFRVYLKKVFSVQERNFLQCLLAGKESPYKIGRALGVEHFTFLQGIQLKAYKNVKPLAKLAKMTGWSGAESFTNTIYKRLEQLNAGFSLNEIIPQNAKIQRLREKKQEIMRRFRANNAENYRAYRRKLSAQWREKNRENIREYSRRYHKNLTAEQRERRRLKQQAYYQEHAEEIKEKDKVRREKINATPELFEKKRAHSKNYYNEHAEEIKEKRKARYLQNREEENAKQKAYYAANREKIITLRNSPERIAKKREYMAAYCRTEEYKAKDRARKKAKKLSSQMLAGLRAIPQTEAEEG